MEQVAIISDVHGNMTAYEAVLADIDARGIGRIFNLGDVFGKGPNGSAVVATTRERCEATVLGNWDVLARKPREDAWPPLTWWLDEMTGDDLDWVRSLPFSLDLELGGSRVRLFHASSNSVFHRVFHGHTDEDFRAMFANTDATGDGPEPDVVVYGDIHWAYIKESGGKTLVNAGSVGNPLDEPTAAYAVLSIGAAEDDVQAGIVRVPYDIEREIGIAAEMGMPELEAYAVELRTSVYRGMQARTR